MPEAKVFAADLYERLGVSNTATLDEVRHAYRALLRRFTPERAPNEFKRIREAYEALSNARTRTEYDGDRHSTSDSLYARANAAMEANNYPAAEVLLKQFLIENPNHFIARNLLGLCLAYEGKPDEAIIQYERLLRDPAAAPTVWANAGHAYRALKDFDRATHCFQEAVSRGGEDIEDYFVAWADVWLDQGKYSEAAAILDRGIRADGKVDFDDMGLLLKQLEIRLFQRDDSGVQSALDTVVRLSDLPAHKQFTSWKLGTLAIQLIKAQAFTRASEIAAVARQLQPEDVDYDALYDVAGALQRNDFDAVLRVTRTHVSFAAGGWLNGLTADLLNYCATKTALNGVKPIRSAPPLRMINGIGTTVYGRRGFNAATQSYITTLYFVFFFVPVVPLACYRVIDALPGYRFLGKVPFEKTQKLHLGIVVSAFLLWLATSAMSSNTSTNYATAQSGTYLPDTTMPAATIPDTSYTTGTETAAPITLMPSGVGHNPSTVYTGTVINSAMPSSPAHLRLAFDSAATLTTGYATVELPLAGSGSFVAGLRSDSVYILSVSETGDSIAWFGKLTGRHLGGRYFITGGVSRGEGGSWDVRRDSGAALPSR